MAKTAKELGEKDYHPQDHSGAYGGLTLRQHYAGLAMQALLAGKYKDLMGNSTLPVSASLAMESLVYADALLVELAKEGS